MYSQEAHQLKKAWYLILEEGVSVLDLYLYDTLKSSPETEGLTETETINMIGKIKDMMYGRNAGELTLEKCIEEAIYNYY